MHRERCGSLTTLKLLLMLAVTFGWEVFTGDISTAFLHALITGEDIFVISPSEFYPEQNVVEIEASTLPLKEFSKTLAGPSRLHHEEVEL